MTIFNHVQSRYEQTAQEEYSLQEYLEICKQDRMSYATAAERMLQAIGEPEIIDTSVDPTLSRIFSNKIIRRYPVFDEFYGMEECIEQIVSYFRHAAQGLEERKQILYLLGPVGGFYPKEYDAMSEINIVGTSNMINASLEAGRSSWSRCGR